MVHESPILRQSASVQASGLFSEVHLVGIVGDQVERFVDLGEGRHIVRLGRSGWPGHGAARAWARLSWFWEVFWTYQGRPVSVVNAMSVWMLPVCWLLAKRSGAELIYATQELETETPTMVGRKKRVAKVIESALIGRCALISCVNRPIADWYMDTYGVPPPLVIRNLPDVTVTEPVDLRSRLGIDPEHRIFIHTGRLTGGRHLSEILAAFASGPKDCVLVLLGGGELAPMVEAAAAVNDNIFWLPPVAPGEVVSYVSAADVSLCLIETKALSYRFSAPNKLFEGLATGHPVLCTDLPAAREFYGAAWDDWHIVDVPVDLPLFIRTLDDAKFIRFADNFTGLPVWEEEIEPLISALGSLLSRPASHGHP